MFGTRGVVTSPGYPGTHNASSDCWWRVRVPRGQRIQLRWDTFSLHSDEAGGCGGNYLELVDGLNSGSVRRLVPRYNKMYLWDGTFQTFFVNFHKVLFISSSIDVHNTK